MDRKIHRIALLISLACVLQIFESLIPHPIPGLRLGLANMLTLAALVLLGFRYALEVAVLRTILSSFLLGTFLSPGFILSFSGAVVSTLAMGFFHRFSGFHPKCRLSIIGISIIGAVTHNLVQLYLAYLLLVRNSGIFFFFPWLLFGALATGWVVGVVTGGVCRRLAEIRPADTAAANESGFRPAAMSPYVPGRSPLHRLAPELKLGLLLMMALAMFFNTNLWFYLGLWLLLSAAAAVSRMPPTICLKAVRRYLSLIAAAFLFPILFNSGATALAHVGAFKITHEGLHSGSVFALRIFLLILASLILARTTSPREMTRALALLMWPLRCIGLSRHRTAAILSLSWEAVPYVWACVRKTVAGANLRQVRNLRHLLPLLTELIAELYVEVGSRNVPEDGVAKEPVDPLPGTITATLEKN